MKEQNLKQAQLDIDEALCTIETLEENLKLDSISEDVIKNNFLHLTEKLNEIERVLKEEGIL